MSAWLKNAAEGREQDADRLTDCDPSKSAPLRLAVYGHLDRRCGSSPGSHYLLIEYLLDHGHRVDLYAVGDFVEPQDLRRYSNLEYRPRFLPVLDRTLAVVQRLPTRLGWCVAWIANTVRMRVYYKAIAAAIRRQHRAQPYDALLVLDLASPFPRIDSLPCVNWAQGSPWGEWNALRRQKHLVIHYGSRLFYWAMGAYYAIRIALARRLTHRVSRLICCSCWTAGCWEKLGFPSERISAIPFAVDLRKFSPRGRSQRGEGSVTFLHLGRIVPRKRLDLLLEAFELLRQELPDVKLLIVGRFVYPRRLGQSLPVGNLPAGVEYRESVPRASIPDLMSQVDILVQPSENEDFGSSVMEALACGVPVVVGPTNGTGEYAGDAAFRFDSYTAPSLRDALRAAVQAVNGDSESVQVTARSTAERYFAPEQVAEMVLGMVRRTIAAEQTGLREPVVQR